MREPSPCGWLFEIKPLQPLQFPVRRIEKEPIALANQLLGALLIEDDLTVDARRGHEGDTRRHVGLDKAGNHTTDGRCVPSTIWLPTARAFCARRIMAVSAVASMPFGFRSMRSAYSSITSTIFCSLSVTVAL